MIRLIILISIFNALPGLAHEGHWDTTFITADRFYKTYRNKTLFGKEITKTYDDKNRLIYKCRQKAIDSLSYEICYLRKKYNSQGVLITKTRSRDIVSQKSIFIKKRVIHQYFNNGELQGKTIRRNQELKLPTRHYLHTKKRRDYQWIAK